MNRADRDVRLLFAVGGVSASTILSVFALWLPPRRRPPPRRRGAGGAPARARRSGLSAVVRSW